MIKALRGFIRLAGGWTDPRTAWQTNPDTIIAAHVIITGAALHTVTSVLQNKKNRPQRERRFNGIQKTHHSLSFSSKRLWNKKSSYVK
jgi:hypothetical protein